MENKEKETKVREQLWKVVASDKAMAFYGLVIHEDVLAKIAHEIYFIAENRKQAEKEEVVEFKNLRERLECYTNGKIMGMLEVSMNLRFPFDSVTMETKGNMVYLMYNSIESRSEFPFYEFKVDPEN